MDFQVDGFGGKSVRRRSGIVRVRCFFDVSIRLPSIRRRPSYGPFSVRDRRSAEYLLRDNMTDASFVPMNLKSGAETAAIGLRVGGSLGADPKRIAHTEGRCVFGAETDAAAGRVSANGVDHGINRPPVVGRGGCVRSAITNGPAGGIRFASSWNRGSCPAWRR